MEKRELHIVGIAKNRKHDGAYTLLLHEVAGVHQLSVLISEYDAHNMVEPDMLRSINESPHNKLAPFLYNVINNLLSAFSIAIIEVMIKEYNDGFFHTQLHCVSGTRTITIDTRISDAIALALRCKCPIYASEQVLTDAGEIINTANSSQHKKKKSEEIFRNPEIYPADVEQLSTGELIMWMKKTVEQEDYHKAAVIRDELNRRK